MASESAGMTSEQGAGLDDSRIAALVAWVGWMVMGPVPALALLAASWRSPGSFLRTHALAASIITVPVYFVTVVMLVLAVVGSTGHRDPMLASYLLAASMGVLLIASAVGAALALMGKPTAAASS